MILVPKPLLAVFWAILGAFVKGQLLGSERGLKRNQCVDEENALVVTFITSHPSQMVQCIINLKAGNCDFLTITTQHILATIIQHTVAMLQLMSFLS